MNTYMYMHVDVCTLHITVNLFIETTKHIEQDDSIVQFTELHVQRRKVKGGNRTSGRLEARR